MSDSNATPPQPGPVTPHLTIDGAAAAIEFYKAAFGAEEVTRMPGPDGKLMHAALLINGGMVMLADDFPEMMGGMGHSPTAIGGSPVAIHLQLADVDATWAQAVAAGATVTMPLDDMFWGDRYGQLRDPYGHVWSLATTKKVMNADEMNAAMKAAFSAPA